MRTRLLKPGFFRNVDLLECQPLARILFAGLWCLADKEGRLLDRPKQIKLEVLPCDDCDISGLLMELHERGLIIRYSCNGLCCIEIPNFTKHQSIHPNEKASEIPSADDPAVIPYTPSLETTSGLPLRYFLDTYTSTSTSRGDHLNTTSPEITGQVMELHESTEKKEEEVCVLEFPTHGTTKTWLLKQPLIDEFSAAYPGLDVLSECRLAKAWVISNRPKTATGMKRFLNGWLGRANDRLKATGAKRQDWTCEANEPAPF